MNNPLVFVDKDGKLWFVPILVGAAIGAVAGILLFRRRYDVIRIVVAEGAQSIAFFQVSDYFFRRFHRFSLLRKQGCTRERVQPCPHDMNVSVLLSAERISQSRHPQHTRYER